MGTFDNIYLNKIKQLHEENLKLKQIINEEVYGPGAYPAVSRVDLKRSDLETMPELKFPPTSEELIRMYGKPGDRKPSELPPDVQDALGAAHVEEGHPIPANLIDNFPHYARGVNRAYKYFGYPKSENEKRMNP